MLCHDFITWGRWMQKADRRVAETRDGGVRVSTVFLGLDHRFGKGPPLLFETTIFGGEHDQYRDRASSWEEAEVMHAEACVLAFPPKADSRFQVLDL